MFHKHLSRLVVALSLFMMVLCTSGRLDATTFTVFDAPGAVSTVARGINNAGQIAGISLTNTASYGFVRDNCTYTTFQFPAGSDTAPMGINNHGQVVGFTIDPSNRYVGFIKDGQTFTTFSFPGEQNTLATSINDNGDIVGYVLSIVQPAGFLKHGQTYSPLAVPHGFYADPMGINNAGAIVGLASSLAQSGFLLSGSTFTTLPRDTYGINNLGQIVGGDLDGHAFVINGSTVTRFDVPGAVASTAYAINDLGQIAGSFIDAAGIQHGFATDLPADVPVMTVSATPSVLWPANHKLVRIAIGAIATDVCDPAPRVELLSITSNESSNGTADGNTQNDIVAENGNIYLRAERSGSSNDRIYTITYRATNASGNSATGTATVTVPHDRR